MWIKCWYLSRLGADFGAMHTSTDRIWVDINILQYTTSLLFVVIDFLDAYLN